MLNNTDQALFSDKSMIAMVIKFHGSLSILTQEVYKISIFKIVFVVMQEKINEIHGYFVVFLC